MQDLELRDVVREYMIDVISEMTDQKREQIAELIAVNHPALTNPADQGFSNSAPMHLQFRHAVGGGIPDAALGEAPEDQCDEEDETGKSWTAASPTVPLY